MIKTVPTLVTKKEAYLAELYKVLSMSEEFRYNISGFRVKESVDSIPKIWMEIEVTKR
jgi:hypothetical protein